MWKCKIQLPESPAEIPGQDYPCRCWSKPIFEATPRIENAAAISDFEERLFDALKKHVPSKLVEQMRKTKNYRMLPLLSISLEGLAAYGELPHTIIVTDHSGFRKQNNVANI